MNRGILIQHCRTALVFILASTFCALQSRVQATVVFEEENGVKDLCKFKSDYFSEFDLNPLTKPDGSYYSNGNLDDNLRLIEFNICEPIVDNG